MNLVEHHLLSAETSWFLFLHVNRVYVFCLKAHFSNKTPIVSGKRITSVTKWCLCHFQHIFPVLSSLVTVKIQIINDGPKTEWVLLKKKKNEVLSVMRRLMEAFTMMRPENLSSNAAGECNSSWVSFHDGSLRCIKTNCHPALRHRHAASSSPHSKPSLRYYFAKEKCKSHRPLPLHHDS